MSSEKDYLLPDLLPCSQMEDGITRPTTSNTNFMSETACKRSLKIYPQPRLQDYNSKHMIQALRIDCTEHPTKDHTT